jgi:dTDP-4-amino-4,6-dideoxygalactose transaminase
MIQEKGTDRARFHRGEVDQYCWRDIGSSFVIGELNAAFLLAQLEAGGAITGDRLRTWEEYRKELAPLVRQGRIEIAHVPEGRRHNGHLFWIKAADRSERTALLEFLDGRGIRAMFHYVPLHSSPAGRRFGRFSGADVHTSREADRLLRLPIFFRFSQTARVAEAIREFYSE